MDYNNVYWGNSIGLLAGLEDDSIDCIITDPMYDLENDAKEYYHNQFLRVCKGAIIVFMPPENQWVMPAKNILFWVKPISTKNTSRNYSRFVEMIFVYGGETWNAKRHWSQYTNVFTDLVDDTKVHPWRKPPSLITRLMLNHTDEGDLVLDPFAGSGVVLEVAKRLGRNYIGMEIDEEYVEQMKEQGL